MNIMKHRKWYYLISLAFIIPGLLALIFWGLKPSIDFTGGTRWEIKGITDTEKAKDFITKNGIESVTIQKVGDDSLGLRFKEIDEAKHKELKGKINDLGKDVSESSFEIVGPSVSKETTQNAFISIILASLIIIFYVGYSFRKVPAPANSLEFGIFAVVALLHDVIIVCGVFAVLGKFYNIEVDPLFITGLLTVIGFSVHDTIVIFDRIRENLIKSGSENFEEKVNLSIIEMLPRTINTSFLVWIMLLVLVLFGGASIKYFVLTLVVGILSGTYSSIFNASPLLITWNNFKKKLKKK